MICLSHVDFLRALTALSCADRWLDYRSSRIAFSEQIMTSRASHRKRYRRRVPSLNRVELRGGIFVVGGVDF